MHSSLCIFTTTAILLAGPSGYAAPATNASLAPDRPYGNVMGDGLGLRIATDPQAGGVCAPGETLFGIDVSYYQGTIDWNAVAADGVQFAIVRVSHSTSFFDPEFDANLAGARAAGIHTGVYQYFEPAEDAIAQADLLLDAMGPLMPGDLPPMIDVESTGGLGPSAINDAIHAWIDRVEGQLGVKPIIYSGYYFWQENIGSTDFGDYPLVIPWYGVDCPGAVQDGWATWSFHQYCDCGSVAGISGNVDVDRFNGGLADLQALAFAAVCGDATCSGGETPYTCAEDCPPCGTIAAEGGTIDNGNACYILAGDAQYWHEEPVGEGGSSIWTLATDLDQAYNFVTWQLHFLESGRYELEMHVTQPFGQSKQAGYVVRHADGETPVVIDQSANDGWVALGEFQFTAATDHTVRLGDNTGEPEASNIQLVFDALRITRTDLGGGDTVTESTDPSEGEGGGGSEGENSSDDGDGIGPLDPGGTDDTAGDGIGSGAQNGTTDDGCGCDVDAPAPTHAWLPLVAIALRRRRRRY